MARKYKEPENQQEKSISGEVKRIIM